MAEDDNNFVRIGESLVRQLVELGINGAGPLASAEQVAEEHLVSAGGDRERAIERLVSTHVRMAAVSGFVTGLGGAALLPITVPASLTGLYIVSTRMTGAIAHLRGYDINTDEVQSAIIVCQLGAAGSAVVQRAGVDIGRKSAAAALQRVPGRVLIEINKKVGFRLVTKAGQKGAINLIKIVPVVGGGVGAAVDGASCRAIAGYAKSTFEPITDAVSTYQDVIDVEFFEVETAPPVAEA